MYINSYVLYMLCNATVSIQACGKLGYLMCADKLVGRMHD